MSLTSSTVPSFPLPDTIASAVITKYDSLPPKYKPPPPTSPNTHNWIPLAGIVLSGVDTNGQVRCVALGTGTKCLPACRIPLAKGNVLHDWHAEVVAMRAFNLFLLEEIKELQRSGESEVIRRVDSEIADGFVKQPYTIRPEIRIHMYCSEAPCGDASMELVMDRQDDATPWPVRCGGDANPNCGMLGRGHFSELGVVRRKPARGDSPPSLSKSCSDKLALKQCTSLLNSLTSLIVSPENAYLSSLVLPRRELSVDACSRAFSPTGRMRSVSHMLWPGGFRFRPFTVLSTNVEFSHSRYDGTRLCRLSKGSNLSTAWTPPGQQCLINGVLQGRKQDDPRGASAICRRMMWRIAKEVGQGCEAVAESLDKTRYIDVKSSDSMDQRRMVISYVRNKALKGWICNEGDDVFDLDNV